MPIMSDFDKNPLSVLDRAVAEGALLFWISRTKLCVAHEGAARGIMRNHDAAFAEHSDFFDTVGGTFGPRAAQIALAERVKALVLARTDAWRALDWFAFAPSHAEWPRAGNEWMWRLYEPILAGAHRSRAFRAALMSTLDARIFGREGAAMNLGRRLRRFRYAWAFAVERERFKKASRAEGAEDILDIVFAAAPHADDAQLLEIYNSFVFAIVSSVALALGWAVHLAIVNDRREAPAHAIVLESLRLYPIAWYFERRTTRALEIEDVAVGAADVVAISPYAMHRSPVYWTAPTQFVPERWRSDTDRRAWMPFGAGPHMCVAGGFVIETVAAMAEAILQRSLVHRTIGSGPQVAAALAPPRFQLSFDA